MLMQLIDKTRFIRYNFWRKSVFLHFLFNFFSWSIRKERFVEHKMIIADGLSLLWHADGITICPDVIKSPIEVAMYFFTRIKDAFRIKNIFGFFKEFDYIFAVHS